MLLLNGLLKIESVGDLALREHVDLLLQTDDDDDDNNSVVMADSINSLKFHLDKFWSLHDFVYDYRAQPLTSGSTRN